MGCVRSPGERITDAGTEDGRSRDTTVDARLPPWCHQKVPHAVAKVGMQAISHDKLEGAQLDFANQRILNCAEYGEKLLAGLQVVG